MGAAVHVRLDRHGEAIDARVDRTRPASVTILIAP